jgi:hypothetical protein
MAGALGFEPRSSVLETDSLTVELTPLWGEGSGPRFQGPDSENARRLLDPGPWTLGPRLLRFLVVRMLAAGVAEL